MQSDQMHLVLSYMVIYGFTNSSVSLSAAVGNSKKGVSMARKVKGQLPSGNIRVRVYDYTDENGKKIYRSFTAKSKSEAQAMASEWKANRCDTDATVSLLKACESYIALRLDILSPATITGYNVALKRIQRHRIARISVTELKTVDLQSFVSDLSKTLSPKSVSNTYGLVSSAIKMYLPGKTFNVTLPAKQKTKLYIPSADDVQLLLDNCKTAELKIAVLFAAVGTMRRGEACAVAFDDVDFENGTISINKAWVKVDNSYWKIKAPKTYESNRVVRLPEFVFELIKATGRKQGYVVGYTPDQLYDRFTTALKDSGLPHFRFHDLRHYAASQLHACGMPERYIEAMGGWKPGSNVLKRLYENVLENEMSKMQDEYMKRSNFRA